MQSKPDANFLRLTPYLRPYVRELFLGGACMLTYVACWPILAWLAGELIPSIGKGDLIRVIQVIIQALIIFLVQKIAQFGQDTLLAEPALRVSQNLRRKLFIYLQRIELDALEKLSSGDLTYRLTEDADRVGEIIYKTIQDTTPCILQLIAVFGYMVILDWKLSMATLILSPIVAGLVSMFGSKVMIAAERSQKQVSELAGLLGEAIQGLPLVRAFAAEEWLQNRFDLEVDLHRQARYKTMKLLALQHPVVGFIEVTGILAVLVIGASRIQTGDLNSQGFSSYVAALLMLIDPISHLTTNFNELQQGQASLKRLNALKEQPMEAEDSSDALVVEKPKGEIVIEDLQFYYHPKKTIINNLNIRIEAGKTFALVGPSGAGKSTIFSLLLRFKAPQKGQITFDGHNISKIKSNNLRKLIALVPQQVTVFSGSIAEAIRFGRGASDSEVIYASKLANAHEFIINMEDGYETQLEERGTNLSGGQLQRIAIARAVLGNPTVLLLDEATSALDAEAEEAVQLGLRQAMRDRTVIVIAHRLATVQEVDQIAVLENGQICDQGRHDELMRRKGRYRELCERQLIRQ